MIKQISQSGQRELSFEEFIDSLVQKDFVFFGEEHNQYIYLINQLIVMESLHQKIGSNSQKKSINVAIEHHPEHQEIFERFNEGDYDAMNRLPRCDDGCFIRYTKPIFDLCYHLDINVVTVGDKDMVALGTSRILDWNKIIAENLRKMSRADSITIPILGSRHLERINYGVTSTPELLRNGNDGLAIAVILHPRSAEQNSYLYSSIIPQRKPIEQYSVIGGIK